MSYLSLKVAEHEVPEPGLPVRHLDELVDVAAEGDQHKHARHPTEESHPARRKTSISNLVRGREGGGRGREGGNHLNMFMIREPAYQ